MNINLINWIAQLVHRNNGGALGVADCMAAYLWAQRIADEMYGGLFPPQHDYLVGIQERVMPNLPVGNPHESPKDRRRKDNSSRCRLPPATDDPRVAVR